MKYTSDVMVTALRERFCTPAWAFLEQVRNGTGYAREPRTADALAVSVWPSRGLEIHGIEIKVSRGDFVRELKKPQKAESIQRFCHRWWVAAPNTDVVPVADMPPTWGLLVLKGKKLIVAKEAPLLPAQPPDILFLAAVLRKAAEAPKAAEERGFRLGKEEGIEQGESGETLRRELERVKKQYDQLKDDVLKFEKDSGVEIRQWYRGNVGEAVRHLASMLDSRNGPVDQLQGLINITLAHVRSLEEAKVSAQVLEETLGKTFERRSPVLKATVECEP